MAAIFGAGAPSKRVGGGMRRGVCGVLACLGVLATVQQARAASCPPEGFRWLEDCSGLAASQQLGLDRLRYQPLTEDGRRWVSVGGEYRFRIDAQADALYGLGGANPYIAVQQRLLAHADLRDRTGLRGFVQFSRSEEDGRIPRRGIGESDVDLAQGFVDVPISLKGIGGVARLGRQELDLRGNFLLGARNVALRRSFNGALMQLELGEGLVVRGFHGAPTQIRPGAFDDRSVPGETLTFAVADRTWTSVSASLFYFRRERGFQRYGNASGIDERSTFGGRMRIARGPWSANGQFAWQTGHVGDDRVQAWAGQFDLRRSLPYGSAVGAQLLSFSGDAKPGDGRYGGFDALYPNLAISSAPLFMSTNLTAASVLAEKRMGKVTLGGLGLLAWRSSLGDSLYMQGADFSEAEGRLQSALFQLSAQVGINRRLTLNTAFVHAEPLKAVRSLGGRPVDFLRVEMVGRL